MYLEFIYSIFDYYRTLDKRTVLYEVVLPFLLGGFIFYLLYCKGDMSSVADYRSSVLSLLGVLVGFSITIITILTTGTSRNILAIQEKMTDYKIKERQLSLFDLLLINFTYSVILEILLIIVHLVYPFVLKNFQFTTELKVGVFCLMFVTVIHVLLLTIRNMTNFYFIILKK